MKVDDKFLWVIDPDEQAQTQNDEHLNEDFWAPDSLDLGNTSTTVTQFPEPEQPQGEDKFFDLLEFLLSDSTESAAEKEKVEDPFVSNVVNRNVAVVANLFSNQTVVGSAAVGSASDDPRNAMRINQVSGVSAGITTLASILPSVKTMTDTQKIIESSGELLRQISNSEWFSPMPSSATPIRDMIDSDQYSVLQKTVYSILLANEKMASRVRRLKVKAAGQGITAVGVGLGVAAGVVGGIGALPGGVVASVGGGISMLPEGYAAAKALYKKMSDTKGIDRVAASELLWGLALRKAKREGRFSGNLSSKASQALERLERQKADYDSENTLREAENLASHFLKIARVFDAVEPGENGTLTLDRFQLAGEEGNPDSGGFEKIMNTLRSTTG
jgi:hypothetical protein